uniref:NadR/Ttd14 AAA domain-containing protein n=1 Tax=Rhizochromulina marina TaxID=1034831 RepID=A0A7S2R796_9STRA|mmetsp:Transcript_12084/g.34951  ORF Transcript_12084/g.34951 Transcript_12084/m.34951 type:complete len:442 (+) Transcript_12084:45-1370(+)|eukprot:CAMPEP_0118987374 /NCGR_PEP_ID=MMETSP1173-20130426/44053_1 /TAXON_ID=1034831 /ORGANISM="Rhizochromulina marina cf, Strain CCMP1243" /LENGTH=441 /DNA_ID=CAMNT_0006938217 /DNA_START=1 /DNA_END=1326 /DNA_ORIENTATION=-
MEFTAGAEAGEEEDAPVEVASHRCYKIVLTGGPCAGKTTALERLSSFLRERGFRVYTVPEAATMLFMNGVRFSDLDGEDRVVAFQTALMDIQLNLEDSFSAMATATGEPSVVLCDRGACDGKAYISPGGWQRVIAKRGMDNDIMIREGRYNAVFHLVTAANGAEKFYTLANNNARSEPPEEAREVDVKTQRAWTGHPNHLIFDNSSGFEGKMQRVVDQMARIVGLPLVQRTATKFLLSSASTEAFPAVLRDTLGADAVQVFEVEKIYVLHQPQAAVSLRPSQAAASTFASEPETVLQYSFIRRRTQDGFSAYGHTLVKRHPTGERVEVKRILNRREYNWMKNMYADPSRHVVVQRRHFFLWEGRTYSIHQYVQPRNDLAILHCQASQAAQDAEVRIPPFVTVEAPLDEDGDFSAFRISLRNPISTPSAFPPRASSTPVIRA